MGVAFSHCDAHWSYFGFARFRRRLAERAGIVLDAMAGYVNAGIPWDTIDDPIVPLLNHSDSHGVLTPDECRQVAPRLRELVADWEDFGGLCLDKGNALLLAEGMERAAARGEDLEFH